MLWLIYIIIDIMITLRYLERRCREFLPRLIRPNAELIRYYIHDLFLLNMSGNSVLKMPGNAV